MEWSLPAVKCRAWRQLQPCCFRFVAKFQPRMIRQKEMGDVPARFTNIYVKNFGEHLDSEKLEKLFATFGRTTSCAVPQGADGKPRGFGFVAFEKPEDAEKAAAALNDYELPGTDKKIFVGRAQKKSERHAELKKKYEEARLEHLRNFSGINVFVKNLDESIDDIKLREVFEAFGPITSAKV